MRLVYPVITQNNCMVFFSKINKLSFIFLNGDYLVETAEPVTISLCIACALGKSVRIL